MQIHIPKKYTLFHITQTLSKLFDIPYSISKLGGLKFSTDHQNGVFIMHPHIDENTNNNDLNLKQVHLDLKICVQINAINVLQMNLYDSEEPGFYCFSVSSTPLSKVLAERLISFFSGGYFPFDTDHKILFQQKTPKLKLKKNNPFSNSPSNINDLNFDIFNTTLLKLKPIKLEEVMLNNSDKKIEYVYDPRALNSVGTQTILKFIEALDYHTKISDYKILSKNLTEITNKNKKNTKYKI